MSTGVIVPLLTRDENLLRKLQQVWIDLELDRFELYRDSKDEPGSYSREIYPLSKPRHRVKDPEKHTMLPRLTQDAREYLIGGSGGSATVFLDESKLQELIAAIWNRQS